MSLSSILSADAIDCAIKDCQGIIFCHYRCFAFKTLSISAGSLSDLFGLQKKKKKKRFKGVKNFSDLSMTASTQGNKSLKHFHQKYFTSSNRR